MLTGAAAGLWRYSLNNQLLILAQAAERGFGPSQVAGYKAWQSRGRQVRTGRRAFPSSPQPAGSWSTWTRPSTPGRAGWLSCRMGVRSGRSSATAPPTSSTSAKPTASRSASTRRNTNPAATAPPSFSPRES
ncbi:MAG: ArdC family protein [Stackebrandtia sp.]